MMSKKLDQQELLRVKAEVRLASAKTPVKPVRPAEDLLHDLQVHQIELEMQNEELRRTHVALEEARDLYVDLYEFAPVGYITLSQQAQITAINLTGAALLGEDRKKLLSRSFAHIVAPEDQDRWQHYIGQAFNQHDNLPGELTLLREDGTRFDVRLDSRLIATAGTAPVLRITLVDITLQIKLDYILRDRNIELASARFVADKANQAKSEFLSSMSHDLRSPLNAILGFTQLMQSSTPPPTESQAVRLQHISKAGWYLLELINEILDLSVIESGKLSLKLEAVQLSVTLQNCQSMIESQANKSDIRMEFPLPDDTLIVRADQTRLIQVLINLLSNAIKYNRAQGSVEVSCQAKTDGYLRISVRDTGKGLSAGEIAQLFQSFNRLGQEGSAVQGTGIGLFTSKRLVEMMEGRIGVESSIGLGSEFWIELPLVMPPQPTTPLQLAAEPAAQIPERRDATHSNVLYVEDNQANMLLVEQLLKRRSELHLLKAVNGTDGIAMALAHQPQVILLDINLPDISGIQVLRLLQQNEATAHIPVIAISANAMMVDIERGMAAGFYRYITKPIQIDEFMNALDEALKAAVTASNTTTSKNIK